jgi:hypothetical protein
LTAFLAWFFTVGQALVFAPVVARHYGVDLPLQVFVVSTLIGLLLPAVVITRIVDGPAGVRQLWRRAVDVWVSARWYALALAGMLVLATGLAVAFLACRPPQGAPGRWCRRWSPACWGVLGRAGACWGVLDIG